MSTARLEAHARFRDWDECREQLPVLDWPEKGIARLEVGGESLFVKRGNPKPYGWARIALIKPVVLLLARSWPKSAPLRRAGAERVAHEARRLAELRQAGVAVPSVRFMDSSVLVLEDAGPNLESLLSQMLEVDRGVLIERVGHDMAKFHSDGHWHGAAQLRNLTLKDDCFHRIDFEEDLEGVLPLPLRQAMDALLAAFSIAHCRALGKPERRQPLVERFLSTWADQQHDSAALQELLRLRRWLRPLGWVALMLRPIPSRDLDAFRVLVRSLRALARK